MSDSTRISIEPITGYGVALYPPGATFGPRQTRDWEFVWLIQGHATYRWDGEDTDVPEGSIVLCRPGGVDSFRWDPLRRTRHAYFHFAIADMPEAWTSGWPVVRKAVDGDVLATLFQHVLTIAGAGDSAQTTFAVATMLAAFRSGLRSASAVAQERWPEPVERGLDYIYSRLEEDASQPVSLSQIAQAAHVTPEHLCRVFQSSVGHSPARTVRYARLDRSAILLARSNYTIAEIASLVGFANPFHYSRCFRAAFGESPSVMRERVAAGQSPPPPLLIAHL